MAWFGSRKREIAELRSQLDQVESRAISFPWPDSDPRVPFSAGGPAHPSQFAAGVDRALSLGPVYAASRLLADGVASLPLRVYKPDGDGVPQRYTGPTIFASRPGTQLGPMGQGPSVSGTLYDFLFAMMTSLTLEGNCFAWIVSRDNYGYPTGLELMPANLVHIDEGPEGGIPNPAKAEYYFAGRHVPKEDIFHVRAYTVAGRTRGISPLRAFAAMVDSGLSMQNYGLSWFQSGGFPLGILRNQVQEVNDEQSAEIKSRMVSALRRRQPLVMGSDWEYSAVSVSPEEAQFVLSQQMNSTQVAAVFGVPPYRIGGTRGDSLTYSSTEAEAISFATDTLRPWLRRLEQAFYGLLPGNRYCVFDVSDGIKMDGKTVREIAAIDRASGFRTADEVRRELDLAPLPGGAGHDELPLTLSADLGRAGIAIPKAYSDDVVMLNQTPPPGPEEPVTGDDNVLPLKRKGPAQVQPPAGEPVASVKEAARAWAGDDVTEAELRPYIAEAALQAARHGVKFRSPVDMVLAQNQLEWLTGYLRGTGEPQAKKIG